MKDQDLYADACYEAWMSGKDPDLVDRGFLEIFEKAGLDRETIIQKELKRITPPVDPSVEAYQVWGVQPEEA